jgi:8-oxo-dGTP pyrophosphatase MutT (NUDIX family)
MKELTLLFLLKDNHVLLAMKKRGFGAGRWNGVGGKIEPGETTVEAAIRECSEEIGVTPQKLIKVAHHTFTLPGNVVLPVHTFIAHQWQGEPTESEEMSPSWFAFNNIPYDNMWDDDRHWLPQILAGKKLVCEFAFNNNDIMISKQITEVPAAHYLLQ